MIHFSLCPLSFHLFFALLFFALVQFDSLALTINGLPLVCFSFFFLVSLFLSYLIFLGTKAPLALSKQQKLSVLSARLKQIKPL